MMKRLSKGFLLLIAAMLVIIGLRAMGIGKPALVWTEDISLAQGELRGLYDKEGGEAFFKGIPFAAPPIGELRWRPPEAALPWEGVKEATDFGAACMQDTGEGLSAFLELIYDMQGFPGWKRFIISNGVRFAPELNVSEDCLFLNIRTRNLGGETLQPVMVWIHGGGHTLGSSGDVIYHSTSLTEKGVVIVTINYRLGALGYFAHPALVAESPNKAAGNYGLMDQIAALKWVKDNIAQFGGDPDNVTIFGESAGGWSVTEIMASPLAKGLFHKAIAQSGASVAHLGHLNGGVPGLDDYGHNALYSGGLIASYLGLEGEEASAEELRAIPAEDLVALFVSSGGNVGDPSQVNADGYVLPKTVGPAFLAGDQAPVPFMTGFNADEGTLLYPLINSPLMFEAGDEGVHTYEALIKKYYPIERALKIKELYGFDDEGQSIDASTVLLGDEFFGAPARFVLREHEKTGAPAYAYHFTRVPPSKTQTGGAFHAAEIPFIFNTHGFAFPKSDKDDPLIEAMMSYWTNFAKTGNPNGEDLPHWPQYEAAKDPWMILGHELKVETHLRKDRLDVVEANLRDYVEKAAPLQ